MTPVIAQSVYKTLQNLAHPLAPYLSENLSKAQIIGDHALEKSTISLNSTVEYAYANSFRPIRIQIVLPEQEDLDNRKISVLAPISRALLGFKEGDELRVQMPSGEKRIRILKVTP